MQAKKVRFITAHLIPHQQPAQQPGRYVTIRAHEDAVAPGVLIRGEGVAACCCAHLLSRGGLPFGVETGDRPRVPAIMLGEATQKLLADVFDRRDLFDGLPRINKRIVAWGKNSTPIALPHSAVVVSEEGLLDRIQSGLSPPNPSSIPEPTWTIFAARPLPRSSEQHNFGSRMATASAVILKAGSDRGACWIESLDHGWLFLLPGDDRAWLLSVGDPAETLLARSRLISDQIAETSASRGTFPSHPRIVEPLCEPGWLACGTAALGFDPLCGDGTGHAIREAILASAVVRAGIDGADVDALVAHYRNRLLAGFKRHLEACREFYLAGQSGPWWDQELDSLHHGLEWCARRLESAPVFRFRLSGFALEAID
jgi:hypothetical protein